MILPDVRALTAFPRDAPRLAARGRRWRRSRQQGADAAAADEIIAWWKARGHDPRDKLIVLPTDTRPIDSPGAPPDGKRRFAWLGHAPDQRFLPAAPAPAATSGTSRRSRSSAVAVAADGRLAVKPPTIRRSGAGQTPLPIRVFGTQGSQRMPVEVRIPTGERTHTDHRTFRLNGFFLWLRLDWPTPGCPSTPTAPPAGRNVGLGITPASGPRCILAPRSG